MSTSIYAHHIVYKITNLITNKIYVGLHSTDDLDDGYMGSGVNIKQSISKYGKENFTKEIVEVFPDREQAKELERNIVTEEFITRQDTYNASLGGGGGLLRELNGMYGKTASKETRQKISENAFRFTSEEHPKSISVVINGTKYPSMRDASNKLGISRYNVKKIMEVF